MLGVVYMRDHRHDAGNCAIFGDRRRHEKRQIRIARKVARAANAVHDARPHDMRRVDVAVNVRLNHCVHGNHAQAAHDFGVVADFLRPQHDAFAVEVDVLVEVAGVLPDGRLIPSSSVGNNKTWLEQADKIILEVNTLQNPGLEGMHDIYYGTRLPPHRKPIPLTEPGERIGEAYLTCDLSKVIAVVHTNQPDRNSAFAAPDENSQRIAAHIIEFLQEEVKLGRLPPELLPIQSGVGNIANAVLAGLDAGPFKNLTAYTEVLQDGMLDMLRSGTLKMASATALSFSPDALADFNQNIDFYR